MCVQLDDADVVLILLVLMFVLSPIVLSFVLSLMVLICVLSIPSNSEKAKTQEFQNFQSPQSFENHQGIAQAVFGGVLGGGLPSSPCPPLLFSTPR